jgi:hypothetical protein
MEPCKIELCQIQCPTWLEATKDYRFTEEVAHSQEQRILKHLNLLDAGVRFAVFPECSIPEDTLPKLIAIAKDKNIYIIGGLEYDRSLRDRCVLVTPSGKCYKSAKLSLSKYDHPKMRRGEFINCFINSGFGDFAVLVCYDYTSQDLIKDLSGKVDTLFVLADNRDITTFSQKAASDCWSSYCFVVICNNAIFGDSGVYGPLDKIKGEETEKKILEMPRGEICESFELDIRGLREAIERKTGLTLADDSRFKAVPANFQTERKLSASKPQLEYTLLDWPEPFEQDCVIIIGSATQRAIYRLSVRKDTFEKIKQIDWDFFKRLEPYVPYPPEEKYYTATPSNATFLPQLTARLLASSKRKEAPQVYEDDWVIEGDRIHPLLFKHNIISIGAPEFNKVSEKINEELKKDGHVYFPQKRRPHTIFDEFIGTNIESGQATDKAGVVGLTRNPFNPNKLALLCGGIRGIGTAASVKFLAGNDGEAFSKHRYGLTVFAINLDRVGGFPKGPVGKVLKISDTELDKYLTIFW